MIFHDTEGRLVEIIRANYTDDTSYYRAIMAIRGIKTATKDSDTRNTILDLVGGSNRRR